MTCDILTVSKDAVAPLFHSRLGSCFMLSFGPHRRVEGPVVTGSPRALENLGRPGLDPGRKKTRIPLLKSKRWGTCARTSTDARHRRRATVGTRLWNGRDQSARSRQRSQDARPGAAASPGLSVRTTKERNARGGEASEPSRHLSPPLPERAGARGHGAEEHAAHHGTRVPPRRGTRHPPSSAFRLSRRQGHGPADTTWPPTEDVA